MPGVAKALDEVLNELDEVLDELLDELDGFDGGDMINCSRTK